MRFFSLLSAFLLTHSALHAGLYVTQGDSSADIMLHNGHGAPPRIVYATRLNKGTGTLEKGLFDVHSFSLENGVLTGKIQGEAQAYTIFALGTLEALCYDANKVFYAPTATFSSLHNATTHGPCMAHIPLAVKPYHGNQSTFWTVDGAAFRERGPGDTWVAEYFFPQTWTPSVISTDSTRHQCNARTYHLQQRLVNAGHPHAFVFSAERSDPLDTLVLRSKKVNRTGINPSQTVPEYANIKKIWVEHSPCLRPLFEDEPATFLAHPTIQNFLATSPQMQPTLEKIAEEVTPKASSPINHQDNPVPLGEQNTSLSRSDESLDRWLNSELGRLANSTLSRSDASFDRWLDSEIDRLVALDIPPSETQKNTGAPKEPLGEQNTSLSRSDESLDRWLNSELGRLANSTLSRSDASFDRWLDSEIDRLGALDIPPSETQKNTGALKEPFSVP